MPKPVSITLSVRVSDGSFAAELHIPVSATKEQQDSVVQTWLAALQQALTLCRNADVAGGENAV